MLNRLEPRAGPGVHPGNGQGGSGPRAAPPCGNRARGGESARRQAGARPVPLSARRLKRRGPPEETVPPDGAARLLAHPACRRWHRPGRRYPRRGRRHVAARRRRSKPKRPHVCAAGQPNTGGQQMIDRPVHRRGVGVKRAICTSMTGALAGRAICTGPRSLRSACRAAKASSTAVATAMAVLAARRRPMACSLSSPAAASRDSRGHRGRHEEWYEPTRRFGLS